MKEAYAAARISSKLNGRTSKFGWLQAPATNHSLSFQSLSFHPLNNLGPIESQIQALPAVSICPKRAAKTRPSCDELEALFYMHVDGLRPKECRAYRISQTVGGKMVGGYTVIARHA